jgi:hypothetical protein
MEENFGSYGTALTFNSTGFTVESQGHYGSSTVYVAIRRGPMKPPTSAATVFDVGLRSGSGSDAKTTSSIFTDLAITKNYTSGGEYWAWSARNAGKGTLQSQSVDAELTGALTSYAPWATMTGVITAASNGAVNSGSLVDYSFKRAAGFFDMVVYTGTGTDTVLKHNLGALPEFIMIKRRNAASGLGWITSWKAYDEGTQWDRQGRLNQNQGLGGGGQFGPNSSHTTTQFPITSLADINENGGRYIAYLFATLAGVSKCGSYNGTGTTLQIDCGFTAGARFVLIKRADTNGETYIWDSARGITSGNDPYHFVNSTAAQVSNTDYIDPYSPGFQISTGIADINASGGRYVFLAFA